MQFIYDGMSYHLDTGAVLRDLELIYIKALEREPYEKLGDEQKFLLDVAWNYFGAELVENKTEKTSGNMGKHLYDMMLLGYVENLKVDGERGELIFELSRPVLVN
ncbi:hypothetical protein GGQ84_000584 [Desulfitispora alkaliphila]|uniref:hypothetical protein n=1 Tax=Desulfitispora alkaliphila TaxID=622674 RepID=UPI003D221848